MLTLSIRQPYIEEILRGLKTAEIRGHDCRIIGRRFYLYAARTPGEGRGVRQRFARLGAAVGGLPTGLILGTAIITHTTRRRDGGYDWHLAEVRRLKRPRKPQLQPQPVWFRPWK